MVDFNISGGGSTTFTDTTPNGGIVIDFASLDNSLNVTVNGVDLFVGAPPGAPASAQGELEFQAASTAGRTIRFLDGAVHGAGGIPQIWQLNRISGTQNVDDPDALIFRLIINPDGTVELLGVRSDTGALEPMELFNGLSVNTAAIADAWNETGDNTIVVDQGTTGPTNATGEFTDIPCFCAGTRIETDKGPVAVEDLEASDQILTYDNGYKPIRWVGSCHVSPARLRAAPNLRPIIIRKNALGQGHPTHDLIVSPQHRVLVNSAIAKRMFARDEVLVPAKMLLSLEGVEVLADTTVTVRYFHLLFDQHEVIWSNGTPTESFFTGPQALRAIPTDALQEIVTLFPECADPDFAPHAARYIPKQGKRIRKLADRHQSNQKPIFHR